MTHCHLKRPIVATLIVAMLAALAPPAEARTLLKHICRVKGQEENTLHGLGLVVGLKGTGDGGEFLPTIRSLATALQLMGNSLGTMGTIDLKELKVTKNVALVMVTATVPAAGARQGDKLDCTVHSIGSAKSLYGGTLVSTPLLGPAPAPPTAPIPAKRRQIGQSKVFAFAQGAIHLDDAKNAPTAAKVHQGCRLEEDFYNAYVKDHKITLVLDKNHADFQVAQDTAELINSQLGFQYADGQLAKALNQVNVEVAIPKQYNNDPVQFVSQVMSLPTLEPQADARVVVNEKTGSIVIGADVEIGSVVVTHKNIVIETGTNAPSNRFVPIDPEKTATAKLEALVKALNGLKVPPDDIIDVIKGLERSGKLHGTLIVE